VSGKAEVKERMKRGLPTSEARGREEGRKVKKDVSVEGLLVKKLDIHSYTSGGRRVPFTLDDARLKRK